MGIPNEENQNNEIEKILTEFNKNFMKPTY